MAISYINTIPIRYTIRMHVLSRQREIGVEAALRKIQACSRIEPVENAVTAQIGQARNMRAKISLELIFIALSPATNGAGPPGLSSTPKSLLRTIH